MNTDRINEGKVRVTLTMNIFALTHAPAIGANGIRVLIVTVQRNATILGGEYIQQVTSAPGPVAECLITAPVVVAFYAIEYAVVRNTPLANQGFVRIANDLVVLGDIAVLAVEKFIAVANS